MVFSLAPGCRPMRPPWAFLRARPALIRSERRRDSWAATQARMGTRRPGAVTKRELAAALGESSFDGSGAGPRWGGPAAYAPYETWPVRRRSQGISWVRTIPKIPSAPRRPAISSTASGSGCQRSIVASVPTRISVYALKWSNRLALKKRRNQGKQTGQRERYEMDASQQGGRFDRYGGRMGQIDHLCLPGNVPELSLPGARRFPRHPPASYWIVREPRGGTELASSLGLVAVTPRRKSQSPRS